MLDVLIKVDKVIRVMTANCVIRAKSFIFGLVQKLHVADYTYYFFFFLSLPWLLKIADSATIRAILDMQATI